MPNQKPAANGGAKPSGEGGGRRRRRRSRGGQHTAASQQTTPNTQTAPTPAQWERASGGCGRRGHGGQAPAPNRAQPQNQAEPKGGKASRAPAPAPRTAAGRHPAPQPHTGRRGGKGRRPAQEAEEDAGLLLITRRPPKQKFANFEEYIAAHGGVSAPVEGEEAGDLPADPEPER